MYNQNAIKQILAKQTYFISVIYYMETELIE